MAHETPASGTLADWVEHDVRVVLHAVSSTDDGPTMASVAADRRPAGGSGHGGGDAGATFAGAPPHEDGENGHARHDGELRGGETTGPRVLPTLLGVPQPLSAAMQRIVLKAQIKFTVLYAVKAANPWRRAAEAQSSGGGESEEIPPTNSRLFTDSIKQVELAEMHEQIKQVYRFSMLQVEDAVDREFREFEDVELWRPPGYGPLGNMPVP